MPSKSTLIYSNKHDENNPFSCKLFAQYMNAISSSQYEAMAKFYTENGPPGGKTCPNIFKSSTTTWKSTYPFNINSVKAVMEGYLVHAAKKGGKGDAKLDDDICTLPEEARQHLDDEPAKVAGN